MATHHNTIALLPMKGHSERVPGKNFRSFNGKPLFRWILDTLLGLADISLVVINTDARDEIASSGITDSKRIQIRDRRLEICGDMVSMNNIIADDLANTSADTYLMTHTTNPLLSGATVLRALSEYEAVKASGQHDSLFTVNRVQTRFYRGDGSAVNHDPANLIRTQDLEPWYEENSNLYLFTKESFASTNGRIGLRPKLFETPRLESFDIDDQTGWDLAELVCRHLGHAERRK